jgi:integrase
MTTQATELTLVPALCVPGDLTPDRVRDGKDVTSRLGLFLAWLAGQGLPWAQPDLAAYRDHLLARGLNPSSAGVHLASIRSRYKRVLASNGVRDDLYALAPAGTPPERAKAFVDEVLVRLHNALDPAAARVKVVEVRDEADADHVRLTPDEAATLLATPGTRSLRALRDTAAIALALCTGVRKAELAALDVPDLRQQLGGELALRVRHGKGNVQRLVPYGDNTWVLVLVEAWLRAAGITSGPVFTTVHRGDHPTGRRVQPGVLDAILARCPVAVGGAPRVVRSHDLRRSYARMQYDAGLPLASIQQNLGHRDAGTTMGYVGTLDAKVRRSKRTIHFDIRSLNGWLANA